MRNTRRRTLVGAGAAGTLALALSMTGTLSGFAASITNSTNTGGVGSLTMQETGPGADGNPVTCQTTATQTSETCATINKYGGDLAMAPGGAKVTTIQIANTGKVSATSFSLTPGDCTTTKNDNTGDLCNVALVTVKQDGKTIVDGVTPAAMKAAGSYALTPVAAGGSSSIEVTFGVPSGSDNTVQGESVSQPLTWTFNA